jgi:hypothetical protein
MKMKMKRIMITLGAMLLALSACATIPANQDPLVTEGKTLLAIQQSIVAARDAIGVPCQTKIIPHDECVKLDDLYNQSKPMYDMAEAAMVVAATTGDTAKVKEQESALVNLLSNMTAIMIKYNIGDVK